MGSSIGTEAFSTSTLVTRTTLRVGCARPLLVLSQRTSIAFCARKGLHGSHILVGLRARWICCGALCVLTVQSERLLFGA